MEVEPYLLAQGGTGASTARGYKEGMGTSSAAAQLGHVLTCIVQ